MPRGVALVSVMPNALRHLFAAFRHVKQRFSQDGHRRRHTVLIVDDAQLTVGLGQSKHGVHEVVALRVVQPRHAHNRTSHARLQECLFSGQFGATISTEGPVGVSGDKG